MRIDLNAGAGAAGDAAAAGKTAPRAAVEAGSEAAGGDQAQFSTDRARLQSLSAAVLRLPEIRQEKMAALAAQLQSGGYRVGAEQTAGALLQAWNTNRAA